MAKRKAKVSSIKRTNQRQTKLRKQGKLKKRRHAKKQIPITKPPPKIVSEEKEIDSDEENKIKFEEEQQLQHLKENFSSSSYAFLAGVHLEREVKPSRRRKRKLEKENQLNEVEYKYQQQTDETDSKGKKYLLPIKTSEGIITRSMEVEENDDEEDKNDENVTDTKKIKAKETTTKEYTNAELLAQRVKSLKKRKFRIGILCSGLLEDPEHKIQNFKPLLEMLNDNDPEVCITSRKLVIVSLLEIFKDILPEYKVKVHDDPKVKLKKQVKVLRDYESDLLKYYKAFLQKIEGFISVLKKKRTVQAAKEPEISVSILALKCLCDILVAYPYFNYSKNIVQLLIPFLNNGSERVRNIVSNTVKEVFESDKRGEISLNIVQSINKLVKSKNNSVHPDAVLVFLSLKIKDINLDKEKEDELQKKKLNAKKQNILKLSKRERKRKKRLQDLEKELLETKASENKSKKQEYMTEITKLVFMIYFKILKFTPSSRLLNAALEGLAKFAHCINVEFYHDLVNTLDHLIEHENLGFREKLCCVHTVFTILFYQGATIYLDPSRFYSHLYANIVNLNAGKSHADVPLVLKTSEVVLLKRRKYVSLQRLLAFTKRLSLLALQVLPNASLALLNVIREILQVNNSTDVLLDVDSSIGQGIYYPEMNEPEYCNAGVSSLWELLPLQRHYHPTVQEYANIVAGINLDGDKASDFKNILKMSSEELFKDYDASQVKFKPPVPPPKKFPKKKGNLKTLLNDSLDDYIKKTLSKEDLYAEIIKVQNLCVK